jgi:Ca-activated chloride channel homolog
MGARSSAASIAGLLLLVVTTAGAGRFDAGRQPTFRAGVDLVTFGVTAVDRKGTLITDLSAADFEVLEDGKPQTVGYFSKGLHEGDEVATHLGLMLDTSGSMENDLKLARSAAIKFLNLLPEAEDITLVDFDTEVRVTRYPQRDFARLVERIRMRKADGWTALYDALGVYLDGADGRTGRTVLVMYLLKASQVTVYAVGLVEHSGSLRNELRMRLQQMVDATGGQAFFPSALKDLDGSYEKVLAEIRAQYQIGYLSTNEAMDGAWRKVEIKVRRPDVKLRSRKGYFAPMKNHE